MFHTRHIAIFLLISIFCIGTVTAVPIDRTITAPDNEGTITVRVTFPDGMIGGITELIPAGYTLLKTMHPADQTRIEESKVHFAILGEESVTYALSGPATPEISGTILDLTDGVAPSQPPATQSPAPAAAAVFGVILVIFVLIRRELP